MNHENEKLFFSLLIIFVCTLCKLLQLMYLQCFPTNAWTPWRKWKCNCLHTLQIFWFALYTKLVYLQISYSIALLDETVLICSGLPSKLFYCFTGYKPLITTAKNYKHTGNIQTPFCVFTWRTSKKLLVLNMTVYATQRMERFFCFIWANILFGNSCTLFFVFSKQC